MDDTEALFQLRWKADMRAIKRWRAANPGNDLVLPDHADLVFWLIGQLDNAREALKPFAAFAPEAKGFVVQAASAANDEPKSAIMPTKHFRLSHFEKAAQIVRHLSDPS